jgi:hypothetical protein
MDVKLSGRLVEYIVRQPLELNYRALMSSSRTPSTRARATS